MKPRFRLPLWVQLSIAALAITVVACASTNSDPITKRIVDLDSPRPGETRQMRAFTLDNKLEVLLVSDPKFQKSAAAVDVMVGSLEDPRGDEGMAHFLEHLLFLGTEKYPDVEEFDRYMSNNQGSNNAYTDWDHTNYQFEIPHDGYEGALDRFSQFFVAPRFNPEFVEREANAVNSEHQKNLQSDYWRTDRIQRMAVREDHPYSKFDVGTTETLGDLTRERMLEFYNKYYSANVMKLCMLSNVDLDQMEKWAREYFTAVPNHDRGELEHSEDVYDEGKLPLLVRIKPVKDVRTLQLSFPLPSLRPYWRTKPVDMMGSLIGHEGKGSLLSKLKDEGLATALSAGGGTYGFVGGMEIRITLTEDGYADTDRVIDYFFSYVAMLRDNGLERRFFGEEQTVADLRYFFQDHSEGMWVASSMAAAMQHHPALDHEKRQSLYYDFDPDQFDEFLGMINPENLMITLLAPDVDTDQTEYHYNAEYSMTSVSAEDVERWKAAKPIAAFHYPLVNEFIPDALQLLQTDKHDGPYRLIDDERGVLWFEQDRKFDLPKGRVSLLLLSDEPRKSPRARLLHKLYARCLDESLNEWRYPVLKAGLHVDLAAEGRGLELTFNGFSQRIPDLIQSFAGKLESIDIDEQQYAAIQDEVRREFANFEYARALRQAFQEMTYIFNPEVIHQREYRDLIDEITLDEIKQYAERVFDRTAIEGVAYGNFDPVALQKSVDTVWKAVAEEPMERDRRARDEMVKLPAGKESARVFSTKSDNHCWMKVVQFGERDEGLDAAIRLGNGFLESRFYTEMRTRQQLGYIVFSGPQLESDGQMMFFLIQSGEYPASELSSRATAWMGETIGAIRDMSDEEFATIKSAVIAQLEEDDTNMRERMQTLQFEALELEGKFGYDDRVKAAVEGMTREEVANRFAMAFADDQIASISIYLDADGAPASEPSAELISDVWEFKSGLPTF